MEERPGAVRLGEETLTVRGPVLAPGDRAPHFNLLAPDFSKKSLTDYTGRPLFLSVVPSLDTSVCDLQTRRFEEAAAELRGRARFLTVSVDLPPAQQRWRKVASTEHMDFLSDHLDLSFGDAWGTHVLEIRQEQRAVFVVDAGGIVRYAEYVPEIGRHPDYDAALEALRELTG